MSRAGLVIQAGLDRFRQELGMSVKRNTKAPFTLQNIFGTARINMVRVPKNVARIGCLHVLHSAVSTTSKSNFGTVKLSFGTSCGLSFFGQHTKKPLQYACGTFYSNTAEEKRRESLLIKRANLCNRDQCDQQRSINLFYWCIFEISQFYLCFLTLLEHFYMPLHSSFGRFCVI